MFINPQKKVLLISVSCKECLKRIWFYSCKNVWLNCHQIKRDFVHEGGRSSSPSLSREENWMFVGTRNDFGNLKIKSLTLNLNCQPWNRFSNFNSRTYRRDSSTVTIRLPDTQIPDLSEYRTQTVRYSNGRKCPVFKWSISLDCFIYINIFLYLKWSRLAYTIRNLDRSKTGPRSTICPVFGWLLYRTKWF